MNDLTRKLAWAVIFLALPVGVYAQEPSGPTEKSKQAGQIAISAQSLIESKVIGENNQEIGTVKNLMIEPASGRILTVDIALRGDRGLLGVGGGEDRVSVPWEQLSVKRQNGTLVLAMNEQFLAKVKQTQKKEQPGAQARKASVEEIRKAEEALQSRGFNPGTIDGIIDEQTQQALREFQKQNNLKVTGSLDQETAERLGVKLGEQAGPSPAQPQTK